MNTAASSSAPGGGGLGGALGALVAPDLDVSDVLAHLVADCAEAAAADAVALLVGEEPQDLALLAATSHRASEIEMLQSQRATGPCVEAIRTAELVATDGADDLVSRWQEVGTAIVAAGFHRVEAIPMHWRGRTIGGLNVFFAESAEAERPAGYWQLLQAYADMATLVIVQPLDLPHDRVLARLHEALGARDVIEQAKGVIAFERNLDLEQAHVELLRLASDPAATLSILAGDIVRRRGST